MKSQLIAIVAAVLLVGCGESQPSAPASETKPAEPVAEATKPITPPKAVTANKGADPARGIKPEPTTAKAPDISIHKAAWNGNTEAVKQHLAAGGDVNAIVDDWTPLHPAASGGHKEVVELLIADGANVNTKDKGWTPLDIAIEFEHSEIADILRKNGAKTAMKN